MWLLRLLFVALQFVTFVRIFEVKRERKRAEGDERKFKFLHLFEKILIRAFFVSFSHFFFSTSDYFRKESNIKLRVNMNLGKVAEETFSILEMSLKVYLRHFLV